jgi:hypothetical protein
VVRVAVPPSSKHGKLEELAESVLIITGTIGAGKTAVLGEASDILAQRQIVHAAIDLDALGLAHFPSVVCRARVMYNILRSICGNYAGSRAFPASARNRRPCSATTLARHDSGANAVLCRLTASVEAMALKAGWLANSSITTGRLAPRHPM